MFVKIKVISGRRYVYIAEGVRTGKQVKQKTYYLGSLSNLAYGIPDDLKQKIESKNPNIKNWDKITQEIRRIPLTFEEVSNINPEQYAQTVKAKSFTFNPKKMYDEQVTPSIVFKQRREGELLALSIIVKKRFQETYTELDDGKLRLKI